MGQNTASATPGPRKSLWWPLILMAQMPCRFQGAAWVCFMSLHAGQPFIFISLSYIFFPWLSFHQTAQRGRSLLGNISGEQKLIISLGFPPLYFLHCYEFTTLQTMTLPRFLLLQMWKLFLYMSSPYKSGSLHCIYFPCKYVPQSVISIPVHLLFHYIHFIKI